MAEQLNPNQPRILDTFEQPNGSVKFTIDAEAKSPDVFATLAFIEPDIDRQQGLKDALLRGAVEERGLLDNRTLLLNDSAKELPEIAEVKRTLKFTERPTITDVRETFSAIYGEEETPRQLNRLLSGMIDAGAFTGINVVSSLRNEFADADDVSIAAEMIRMANEFGYGDDGESS